MSALGDFLLFSTALLLIGLSFYFYLQVRDKNRVVSDSPYTDALLALLQGDRIHAIQKLKETVQADTSNIDAYLRLGTLIAENGDIPRAIKIHKTLTLRADLKSSQKAEVYRALANDYLKTEDIPRTLEAIEHILANAKKDIWALQKKMELQESLSDWSGAFVTAERLTEIEGTVLPRRLAILKVLQGQKLCAEKKERDGRIQFREALKLDNAFVAPYLFWGDSYIRENRAEDAVKIWKRLLEVNPGQSYLVFDRLESNLFELGRFSEIEQIYRSVIRSYPKNIHAFVALSKFLVKRGDRPDAIQVLEDGLMQNLNSLWLRRRLIQIYADLRDFDKVLGLSRDILARVMREGYDFTCSSCNYVSREPLWQCPKCNRLDSFHV